MLINRIEKEVKSNPILIGGRIMTTKDLDDELEAGQSGSQPVPPTTPKFSLQYFDEKMCYAPSRKIEKTKTELCKTLLPVLESPMSPLSTKRDLHWISPWYNLWTMNFMRPTVFRAYSHMRISAVRNASAVCCAENLLMKSSNRR